MRAGVKYGAAVGAALIGLMGAPVGAQDVLPDRVSFPSLDGQTTLVGYVFAPRAVSGRVPGVIMMHGRAGAYSSAARGRYDASTLTQRHRMWGRLWAEQGYVAMLIDGFGPRGFSQGFARGTYDQRPETLNEVTVRPLDAYGGIAFLRTRRDVAPDRMGLQGWSNGASAVLAAMVPVAADTPGAAMRSPMNGFRAALAFYPGCGLKGLAVDGYRPYAPVRVLQGDADEEVSPQRCAALVDKSRAQRGDIEFRLYPGATHDFDDPGPARQGVDANAAAKADALLQAQTFFARTVAGRP